MTKYLLIGLMVLSTVLGIGLWRSAVAIGVAKGEAKAAAERVAIVKAQTDSVVRVVTHQRDSINKAVVQLKAVVQQSEQLAHKTQLQADSAVIALRETLDSTQRVTLDTVVAKYTARIAADSVALAAYANLMVKKDAEIATYRTENEQLRKFNSDLQAELEAREPKHDFKGDVITAAIGALIYIGVDKALN